MEGLKNRISFVKAVVSRAIPLTSGRSITACLSLRNTLGAFFISYNAAYLENFSLEVSFTPFFFYCIFNLLKKDFFPEIPFELETRQALSRLANYKICK